MPWLKIWMCAGQFIGFSAIRSALPESTGSTSSSSTAGISSGTTNMFSRNLPQWPDWRQSFDVEQLRGLDLDVAVGVELAADVGLERRARA